jgi:hypothetical protein
MSAATPASRNASPAATAYFVWKASDGLEASSASIRRVDGLRVGYWLEVSGEIRLLNDLQWADWDREGHLLVATRSGKLQVWNLDGDGSEVLFEEDLSLSEPNSYPRASMGPAMVRGWNRHGH